MTKSLVNTNAKFGTLPVFFTALSTIPGAILFLRFGWAIGQVGFSGVIGIIIPGHPDWKKGKIKINALYPKESMEEKRKQLLGLIKTGRLPISPSNITMISYEEGTRKKVITKYSADADLTLTGFTSEIPANIDEFPEGYESMGNILFVGANRAKAIN